MSAKPATVESEIDWEAVKAEASSDADRLKASNDNDKILLRYQQRILATVAQSAFVVIEKSRRIGATWALASDAVLRAGKSRAAGGQNVMYISYAMDMTREFVEACAFFARIFGQAMTKAGEFLFKEGKDDEGINAFRIEFASGFKIQALSSAPRSIRGKQGLVIIDEAAFVDSLDELVKAANAMSIWGGRVVIISTHNGVDNPFNKLLDEVKSGEQAGVWLKVTFDQAIADGLYERVALMKPEMASLGRDGFVARIRGIYAKNASEELDVIPSAGGGSWLAAADIAKATAANDNAVGPHAYQGGPCVLGWDVARKVDLSVLYLFELVGNRLEERELIVMKGLRFSEQYGEVDRLFERYRIIKFNIDQTGMGEAVVEEMEERHGESIVEGVMFTSANKLEIAMVLKRRFEDEEMLISNDPLLRADLRSIKKSGGASGRPVFANDNNKDDDTDGHGDRFWAAGLATLAAETGEIQYDYHSAARSSASEVPFGGRRVRTSSGLSSMKGAY
ncbi:terminase large subunit domain-containing protein [Algimonas porphyrae]|uniref:Terminase large subunit gp17-like C-terminal domain-containing protein n=1 Tax=Algimonas porphyrae TaxID=1128113 RepID=A0ABQ5UYY9_9PROT|nr:terminase family protein [Algimonas porphyrae]GLQ20493.1 hypothetical protein GCM10007854_14480 [Algimonas porphyrae]